MSYFSKDFDTFSNQFASKQARMFAFGKMQAESNKLNSLLSQSTTWINTSKKDLKDQNTGKRVKARTIYAGYNNETKPTWEYPAANIDKLVQSKALLDQGESASATDVDKALHDPFYPEFQEPLKYYNDVVLADESAAATHTSQDFPLLNNITVAGQVIVNQLTQFPLLDAVNVENTTDLIFRRYNGTGFDIEAVVGELGTTEPKKMSFSKQEWYTRKSGGEIQWSDEHEMQNYFINPLQLARGQFSIGANKIKNNKILKALAQFSTTAGANLAAITGEHSSNNPYTYFATVRKLINYTNFGNVNTGVMNSSTWYAILSNTYVKGGVDNTQGLVGENGSRTTIPGVPGISFIIDESVADGNVYLFDREQALTRIQGPIRTEQYRLAREGGSGLVYRDWNDVQIRDLTKARTITGFI
jgi:hypothetical protein